MALLLYLLTAVLLLFVVSRYCVAMTRRAMLILVLMPFCFTGYALVTARSLAPVDIAYQADPFKPLAATAAVSSVRSGALSDIYSQMIPWRAAVRYSLSQGEWPLWNPFMFCGDVLAASAQPAPYYPFNLLSHLIPLPDALTYLAAITFFVASLSTFLFLRSLGCSEAATLVGAAGWMFSDFVAFWQGWPLGVSASLLPLVCYGVRLVVDAPSLKSAAVLTIGLILLVLAGHPETVLHCVAVGVAFGLFEMARLARSQLLSVLAVAVAAGVAALLLTAIYLLPILEALPQTADHHYRHDVYALQDHTLRWPTSIGRIVRNFVPLMHGLQSDDQLTITSGLPPGTAWAGSLILALAALGLWRGDRRERWFMLGAIACGLLFGAAAPVTHWFQKLPLFDIALNERLSLAATFGFITLAALGLDVLLAGSRRAFALAAAGSAALVLICSAVMVSATLGGKLFPGNVKATVLSLLVLPVAVLIARFSRSKALTAVLLLLLVLSERTLAMGGFYPSVSRSAFFPAVEELRSIPRDNVSRMSSLLYTFIPNVSALYQLEDVRGYQAMNFRRFVETATFWSVRQPVHYNRIDRFHPFLSFMNVRYLLVANRVPFEKNWREVTRGPSMRVLENPGALERAFVPRVVQVGSTGAATVGAMALETDFGARSWIEAIPDPVTGRWKRSLGQAWDKGPAEFANGPGTVSVRRRGTAFELEAKMENPGWVVVSQTGWSGWRARSGDTNLPIFFANHAFIAFRLPAGMHKVDLRYLPHGFVVGRWISLVSMVLVIGFVLVVHLRTRRARISHRPLS
ncbi:MAG TPA: YfhO family protein [Thermoanaerobaculia bacterium]|nr:YfhO family protein [Thermoanaerobaculia bacterium]